MSLNWDVSKIANKDDVCWIEVDGERRLNPVTEAIIWRTLAVGIGEITEKTAPDWFTRVHAWETAFGPILSDGEGNPERITWTQVQAHIGLRTNVFPRESDAAFARKLLRNLTDGARMIMRDAQRTA